MDGISVKFWIVSEFRKFYNTIPSSNDSRYFLKTGFMSELSLC